MLVNTFLQSALVRPVELVAELLGQRHVVLDRVQDALEGREVLSEVVHARLQLNRVEQRHPHAAHEEAEIGRASCRERVLRLV